MSKHGHSSDYENYMRSPQWRSRAKHACDLWNDRCAIIPFLKSNHAHHMTYANFKHEVVWRDIIPVNKFVHKILHCPLFWVDRRPKSIRRSGTALLLRCWVLITFAIARAFFPKPNKSRRRAH